jgi:FlaA1/EpsC-like NDP-sugar epimerase
MGKPVRIYDLARRMISLTGLTLRDEHSPDGDIAIEFTGLRPAEKLYEELLIGNNVTGTQHPMIMRAMEHSLSWEHVQAMLDELLVIMRKFDCRRAREMLLEAITEYKPAAAIEDLVWRQHSVANAAAVAAIPVEQKVTELATRRAALAKQPERLS